MKISKKWSVILKFAASILVIVLMVQVSVKSYAYISSSGKSEDKAVKAYTVHLFGRDLWGSKTYTVTIKNNGIDYINISKVEFIDCSLEKAASTKNIQLGPTQSISYKVEVPGWGNLGKVEIQFKKGYSNTEVSTDGDKNNCLIIWTW